MMFAKFNHFLQNLALDIRQRNFDISSIILGILCKQSRSCGELRLTFSPWDGKNHGIVRKQKRTVHHTLDEFRHLGYRKRNGKRITVFANLKFVEKGISVTNPRIHEMQRNHLDRRRTTKPWHFKTDPQRKDIFQSPVPRAYELTRFTVVSSTSMFVK